MRPPKEDDDDFESSSSSGSSSSGMDDIDLLEGFSLAEIPSNPASADNNKSFDDEAASPTNAKRRGSRSITSLLTKRKSLDDQVLGAVMPARRNRVTVIEGGDVEEDTKRHAAMQRSGAASAQSDAEGDNLQPEQKVMVESLLRVRSTVLPSVSAVDRNEETLDIFQSDDSRFENDHKRSAEAKSTAVVVTSSLDSESSAVDSDNELSVRSEESLFRVKLLRAKMKGITISEETDRLDTEEEEARARLESINEPWWMMLGIAAPQRAQLIFLFKQQIAAQTIGLINTLVGNEGTCRQAILDDASKRLDRIDSAMGISLLECTVRSSQYSMEAVIRHSIRKQFAAVAFDLDAEALAAEESSGRQHILHAAHVAHQAIKHWRQNGASVMELDDDERKAREVILMNESRCFCVNIILEASMSAACIESHLSSEACSGRREIESDQLTLRKGLFEKFVVGVLLLLPDGLVSSDELHGRHRISQQEATGRSQLASHQYERLLELLAAKQAIQRLSSTIAPFFKDEDVRRHRLARAEMDEWELLVEAHQRAQFREDLRLRLVSGSSTLSSPTLHSRRLSRRVSCSATNLLSRRTSVSLDLGGTATSIIIPPLHVPDVPHQPPPLPPRAASIISGETTSRRALADRWERIFRAAELESQNERKRIMGKERALGKNSLTGAQRPPRPPCASSTSAEQLQCDAQAAAAAASEGPPAPRQPRQPPGAPRCANTADLPPRLRRLKDEALARRDELKQVQVMKSVVQRLIFTDLEFEMKSSKQAIASTAGHAQPFAVHFVRAAPPPWEPIAPAKPPAPVTVTETPSNDPLKPHPPPSAKRPQKLRTLKEIRQLAAKCVLRRHVDADRKRGGAGMPGDKLAVQRDDPEPMPAAREEKAPSSRSSSSSSSSSRSSVSSRSSSDYHRTPESSPSAARRHTAAHVPPAQDDDAAKTNCGGSTSSNDTTPRQQNYSGAADDVTPSPAATNYTTDDFSPEVVLGGGDVPGHVAMQDDAGTAAQDQVVEAATSSNLGLARSSSSSSASTESWHPMSAERHDDD